MDTTARTRATAQDLANRMWTTGERFRFYGTVTEDGSTFFSGVVYTANVITEENRCRVASSLGLRNTPEAGSICFSDGVKAHVWPADTVVAFGPLED